VDDDVADANEATKQKLPQHKCLPWPHQHTTRRRRHDKFALKPSAHLLSASDTPSSQ
jgi:hypothetical protein